MRYHFNHSCPVTIPNGCLCSGYRGNWYHGNLNRLQAEIYFLGADVLKDLIFSPFRCIQNAITTETDRMGVDIGHTMNNFL